MEQHRRDSPPLWLQPPVTALLRRQRRQSSSLISNPVTLAILILLLALILIFIILSPLNSHTCQITRINLVKNRWDSLNVVLVLFAILCGVAGKLGDRESSEVAVHKSNVPNLVMNNNLLPGIPETGSFRIFNDFDITSNYSRASEMMQSRQGQREVEIDDPDIKVIPVDTCVVRQPRQYDEPLKPVDSQPPLQKSRRRQLPKSVVLNEKQLSRSEIYKTRLPPVPPPPPPPTPMTMAHQQQKKNNQIERKKNSTKKEIVTVLASLYSQTKKPNSMKTNIYHNHTPSLPAHLIPPTTPPPLPPSLPPPSTSIFHDIFKKQIKSRRIHTEASPFPPIPPPPPLPRRVTKQPLPSSIFNNIFKSGANSKRFDSSNTPPTKPPLHLSSILNHLYKTESKRKHYYSSLASQSVTPPPSPPPPSNQEAILGRTSKPPLPAKVHKDYLFHTEENVNNFGIQSPPSQCEYAELQCIDDWPTKKSESVKEEIHSAGSIFCPSPDVNTKAEKFIARLRNEWRLDKVNSYREKL